MHAHLPRIAPTEACEAIAALSQVHQLPQSASITALITLLLNEATPRPDFIFAADRLSRMVVETGLSFCPFEPFGIQTPSNVAFDGLRLADGLCAVTVMHGGQTMEQALRESVKGVRVGHILIQHDAGDPRPEVFYAKLCPDIAQRFVLLLDPVILSGESLVTALEVLRDHAVDPCKIVVLGVFASSKGLSRVLSVFPEITIVLAAVHEFCCDPAFSKRYFGQ